MKFVAALFIVSPVLLLSQSIGAGLKGGIPIKDSSKLVGPQFESIRKGDWVLGPMFEVRLPAGLGVEVDALYRRTSLAGQSQGAWEFPVLGKYRFPGIVVRPTIGAGFMFQRLSDIPGLDNRKGFLVSGGAEIKVPFLRIAPELRYTRFNERRVANGFLTGTNQVDVLVGITF